MLHNLAIVKTTGLMKGTIATRGLLLLGIVWACVYLVPVSMAQMEHYGEEPLPDEMVDPLFAPWNAPGQPGAAVAVIKDNRVIFKKGYGMANLEYDVPITPSTVFQVASISKQFTAFSILLLADAGELSLDDDIREYVHEVPGFSEVITLRHLLYHTSGLRDQWGLLTLGGWRQDDVVTREQVLTLLSWQKELNFKPGTEFLYCNTGYTLLAEVVSRVSGLPFPEFTRHQIFEPLGMTRTFFSEDHEELIPGRSYSYHKQNGNYRKSVQNYCYSGATNLYTTLEDMTRWVMNFQYPRVGHAGIFRELNQPGTLANGDTLRYGMGQFINRYRSRRLISHGGSDAGYRAFLGRFPGQALSIIVLSNDGSMSAGMMGLRLADLLIDPSPGPVEPTASLEDAFVPNRSLLPTPQQLNEYCGYYWNELYGFSRRVYLEDNVLYYDWGDGKKTALSPLIENEFIMTESLSKVMVQFGQDTKGLKTMQVVAEDNDTVYFEGYTPVQYTPNQLSSFTGTYFSPELATWYQFHVKGGKLIAFHRRLGEIELEPVRYDLFKGNYWFFNKVHFLWDSEGNIKGFNVSSERVRDLWFEKVGR
jgi:CubicO group peptidase (beta-lactamase class C family)